MTSTNDITGDSIRTKTTSEEYRNNWDLIFRKKQEDKEPEEKVDQSVVDKQEKQE